MSAQKFGNYVGRRMAELGISQNRLASRLGELSDGRVFDATQIRMIREGRRRLDEELVGKLVDLLQMDRAEAWFLAGLWPPDLDLATYRSMRERRKDRELEATSALDTTTTDQLSLLAGGRKAA